MTGVEKQLAAEEEYLFEVEARTISNHGNNSKQQTDTMVLRGLGGMFLVIS